MLESGHDYSRLVGSAIIGCVSFRQAGLKLKLTVGRHPTSFDTAEQGLLVPLDAPHIGKVFGEREANGVGEEEAETGSQPGEDTVGDEGSQVAGVHLRERLQKVAAHLT